MLTRRQFIGGCLGAAVVGAGVWEYTTQAEPFWVQVVRRSLPVRGLPSGLVGARLVQLSDIHVGGRVPDDYVLGQFERVAALKPDILVVTGDLTQAGSAEHAESIYASLPLARLATICTLGNHDYGAAWSQPEKADRLAAALRGLGARVLRSEALSDHAPLSETLLRRLDAEAETLGAQLVTTEKDAARLPPEWRSKVLTLVVRLQLADWGPVDDALARLGIAAGSPDPAVAVKPGPKP